MTWKIDTEAYCDIGLAHLLYDDQRKSSMFVSVVLGTQQNSHVGSSTNQVMIKNKVVVIFIVSILFDKFFRHISHRDMCFYKCRFKTCSFFH